MNNSAFSVADIYPGQGATLSTTEQTLPVESDEMYTNSEGKLAISDKSNMFIGFAVLLVLGWAVSKL